jgi:hypothetical protein
MIRTPDLPTPLARANENRLAFSAAPILCSSPSMLAPASADCGRALSWAGKVILQSGLKVLGLDLNVLNRAERPSNGQIGLAGSVEAFCFYEKRGRPPLLIIHSSSPDPQHRFIVAKCHGPQRLHCLAGHVRFEVRRETGKE